MLSKIAQNITPSATCELEGVVSDMEGGRSGCDRLNAGEPDFDTPQNIREACKRALDEGRTRYINVPGLPALRKACLREAGTGTTGSFTNRGRSASPQGRSRPSTTR